MKGQYYRIDWDTCARLHLYGREAMVYCALIYLCNKAPYTGSATELADFSHCGSSDTALRMLKSLQNKNLILITANGIMMPQNAPSSAQIAVASTQIAAISKEKSTKKENIIKEENNNVCIIAHEETHTTASPNLDLINRLFFMDTLFPAEKPKVPANTGYYKIIILEYGYMNPKEFVRQFYNHWEGKGWPENGNKLFLMRSWMDIYMTKHPKSKPNLSETERIVLKTLLDNIEERLIVRLFNVVKQFEVTDKLIIFYVPEQNTQDFVKWLDSINICKIFAAYNREIKIRRSENLQ